MLGEFATMVRPSNKWDVYPSCSGSYVTNQLQAFCSTRIAYGHVAMTCWKFSQCFKWCMMLSLSLYIYYIYNGSRVRTYTCPTAMPEVEVVMMTAIHFISWWFNTTEVSIWFPAFHFHRLPHVHFSPMSTLNLAITIYWQFSQLI